METSVHNPVCRTVRWMIRRDMPEVLAVEDLNFDQPWTEDDFLNALRQLKCIGMVAEGFDDKILGFMIYELQKNALHVLNFAVLPSVHGQGVGRMMVGRLIHKLVQQGRSTITLEVRDSNLDAHLFFKAMGFEATDILRGHYEDTDEDAYVFEYRLKGECE